MKSHRLAKASSATRAATMRPVGKEEVLGPIILSIGHDDSAFGRMAQGADVARPIVTQEVVLNSRREDPVGLAVSARIDAEIMIQQRRYIFPSLTERRKLDFY